MAMVLNYSESNSMKVRDSGMPEERIWNTFFDVDNILDTLLINESVMNLVEVGCGYGTFTLAAARRIKGRLFAFDIEEDMIELTHQKAVSEGIENIRFHNNDILTEGIPAENTPIDYVMLFNILHHDSPMELLQAAFKALRPGGKTGIIHWRTDMETPRGPDMAIRPKPQQCIEWSLEAGFTITLPPRILEPYHYGLVISKPLLK